MNVPEIARVVDLLAAATVWGATVWFFFVQSPVLLRRLGRERFVPLQMRLTVVLFRTLTILLGVVAAATIVHSGLVGAAVGTAAVALAGGAINRWVVVPRALKAGGRSRGEIKGMDEEGTVAGFASRGAGQRTKLLHRLVVVFVVVMLAGVAAHAVVLLGL